MVDALEAVFLRRGGDARRGVALEQGRVQGAEITEPAEHAQPRSLTLANLLVPPYYTTQALSDPS